MLWTLAPAEEEDETNVGSTGRGMVQSYALLWRNWGAKLSSLALDLGMLLGQDDPSPKGRRSGRRKGQSTKEKSRAKGVKSREPKAKPKAQVQAGHGHKEKILTNKRERVIIDSSHLYLFRVEHSLILNGPWIS